MCSVFFCICLVCGWGGHGLPIRPHVSLIVLHYTTQSTHKLIWIGSIGYLEMFFFSIWPGSFLPSSSSPPACFEFFYSHFKVVFSCSTIIIANRICQFCFNSKIQSLKKIRTQNWTESAGRLICLAHRPDLMFYYINKNNDKSFFVIILYRIYSVWYWRYYLSMFFQRFKKKTNISASTKSLLAIREKKK